MRANHFVTGLLIVALVGCGQSSPQVTRARLAVENLDKAVKTYKTTQKVLPDNLEDLTQERPDGGGAYLPAEALTDPWGRAYQYDRTKLHPDTDQPQIWSDGPNPGQPGSKIANWEVKEKAG